MTNTISTMELQGNAVVNLHLANGTTNNLTVLEQATKGAAILVPVEATLIIDGSTGTLNATGGPMPAGTGKIRAKYETPENRPDSLVFSP